MGGEGQILWCLRPGVGMSISISETAGVGGWGRRGVPPTRLVGGRAMRQTILGSHTPPCHRRRVITTLFSVFSRCLAAQTSSVPHQVVADCALALVLWTLR